VDKIGVQGMTVAEVTGADGRKSMVIFTEASNFSGEKMEASPSPA
jgi:nitrogen regulatory protein PII